jgi:AraC-like DNA-binding protein
MSDYTADPLLSTDTVSLRDVACGGGCKHKGPEECAAAHYLVFPYRGVFVRHLGRDEAVAEANQVLFYNPEEGYAISHPVEGGDHCLSLAVAEPLLDEIAPVDLLHKGGQLGFRQQRLTIDPRTQALMAMLRHSLRTGTAELLEAETLALTLARRALGGQPVSGLRASGGARKIVDRAKLVLASDLARRWTLADVAAEVGVSPVYLTQLFQRVEGVPLYRYQMRLRMARALDLIGQYEDLTQLGLELGFSSHSHFGSTFRATYGLPPSDFRRTAAGKNR